MLPKAQISVEVQLLEVDTDVNYHYGSALPTSFPVLSFVQCGRISKPAARPDQRHFVARVRRRYQFLRLALSSATLVRNVLQIVQSSDLRCHAADRGRGNGQSACGRKISDSRRPRIAGNAAAGSSAIYNPDRSGDAGRPGSGAEDRRARNGDGDISLETDAQYEVLRDAGISIPFRRSRSDSSRAPCDCAKASTPSSRAWRTMSIRSAATGWPVCRHRRNQVLSENTADHSTIEHPDRDKTDHHSPAHVEHGQPAISAGRHARRCVVM